MVLIYARIKNYYKFKYQRVFSARFDKQDEDNQVLDEMEIYKTLNNIRKLTESDIDTFDVRSELEQQVQNQ